MVLRPVRLIPPPSPPPLPTLVSVYPVAGGIYRHVWLTSVATPSAYIAPWGVYAPSVPTAATITWINGAPFADSQVRKWGGTCRSPARATRPRCACRAHPARRAHPPSPLPPPPLLQVWPSVEVWNNGSAAGSFSLVIGVVDAAGNVVAGTTGSGSVAGNGGVTIWNATAPVPLANASLWHLVAPPLQPALYTLTVQLSVGGVQVDAMNATFGVRRTRWDAATGFYLNDVATKIVGHANHQDFAAVGVAVPDVLQAHRIAKLKPVRRSVPADGGGGRCVGLGACGRCGVRVGLGACGLG
jgi:hypothetical protein